MNLLPLHIAAGAVAIAAGAVALYSLKGSSLHRKCGMVFVYAMVLMTLTALVMAVLAGVRFSAMQALLTFYLVTTALLTLRQRIQKFSLVNLGAMILALSVGVYDVVLGLEASASPKGAVDDVPAAMIFIFGGFALLGAMGDLRMMLVSQFQRHHQIARHLWRMGLALWIAVGSFFLGQAKLIPEPLRVVPLLALPVVLVLVATLYWFVRVRFTAWTSRQQRPQPAQSPVPLVAAQADML